MAIDASMVKNDQQELLLTVMSKVKESGWSAPLQSSDVNKARSFKPLYLTVQGCAGSGKSFFIKCLVNTVREVLGEKNVIHVVGPTDRCNSMVSGRTTDNAQKVWNKPSLSIVFPFRKAKRDNDERQQSGSCLRVLDERSMYTADNLGAAERNLAATAHGGGHEGELFGGMPIFLLVGDDYQLPPPTNTQKGAFDTVGGQPSHSQRQTGVAASGTQLFLDTSEKCMELKTIKRQKSDQVELVSMLGRLRSGHPTPADADKLMQHHLTNFGNAEVEAITSTGTTMHLFAKKAPRDEFNYQKQATKGVQFKQPSGPGENQVGVHIREGSCPQGTLSKPTSK